VRNLAERIRSAADYVLSPAYAFARFWFAPCN